MKKILLLVLVVFFTSGCATMKQQAIEKCKESGADTVQMSSNNGGFGIGYALGPVFTNTYSGNSTSASYNCARLLEDNKN